MIAIVAICIGANLLLLAPCWFSARKRHHWSPSDYLLPFLPHLTWIACAALSLETPFPQPPKSFGNGIVEPPLLTVALIILTLIRLRTRNPGREGFYSRAILWGAMALAAAMWFLFPEIPCEPWG